MDRNLEYVLERIAALEARLAAAEARIAALEAQPIPLLAPVFEPVGGGIWPGQTICGTTDFVPRPNLGMKP